MASLFRCNSKQSPREDIVDSEEYMANVDKLLNKWNIPIEKIYKTGFFKFSSSSLKTVKLTVPLSTGNQTANLIPQNHLFSHSDKYNSLHIGLVQLAVGPLTRQGLNGTSVVFCLQDGRHAKFEDSLLGKLEFSLSNGPIYFNCFPNFSVSLKDPGVHRCLTLNIKTTGYNMLPGSLPIVLELRVHYKLMKTTGVPRTISESSEEEKVILQENFERAHVVFPSTVQWSEVQLP